MNTNNTFCICFKLPKPSPPELRARLSRWNDYNGLFFRIELLGDDITEEFFISHLPKNQTPVELSFPGDPSRAEILNYSELRKDLEANNDFLKGLLRERERIGIHVSFT